MALKKLLAQRLFNLSNISTKALTNCRISSPLVLTRTRYPNNTSQTPISNDPGDSTRVSRRFLRTDSVIPPIWIGDNLTEKLREFNISKTRIRWDGLIPPPWTGTVSEGLTVEDTKKLLKAAELELVKTRLREKEAGWISYPEFVRICVETSSGPEYGNRIANMLDESGTVIVLGNVVLLRPELVAKVIGAIIIGGRKLTNEGEGDERRHELEEMEEKKSEIDKKAASLVRGELWGGLAYLVIQTGTLMRLTFWELSWDVMEPICFYLTSIYVMGGYYFFLTTSMEPTFESFYRSRFHAKQKKLMRTHNFDIARYNHLRQIFS